MAASDSVNGRQFYHYSATGTLGPGWSHAGTKKSALDRKEAYRGSMSGGSDAEGSPAMLRPRLTGEPLNTPDTPVHDRMMGDITNPGKKSMPEVVDDWAKNGKYMMPRDTTPEAAASYHSNLASVASKMAAGQSGGVYYVNDTEDKGSVSVAAPRSNWKL